jgi:ABC-2 type transport system permease protein
MKLRIIRNSMTGGKAAWMIIGAVLGVVCAAATVALALARLDAPGLIPDLLATTYLIWMLGWMVGPLWGGSAVLRIDQFALLPLPRRRLALGLLAAAAVGITTAVTALAFLSLVVYGIRGGVAPALVSVPAAAAQLTFVVLLSRVTYALFGAVASSRFGAAVTGVLFAVMLVLTQSGWMLIIAVAYSRVLETGFSAFVSDAVRVIPSGWGVVAVEAAGHGNWWQSLGALAGLLALCALLLLGWSRALARARHDRSVVRGSTRRTTPARGPYFGATGAVLRKELRTWLRDPQRITMATVPVAWALGTALLPLTFHTKSLLPWAGPALPVMAVASAYNLYSLDGTGLWFTLTTGTQRADIRGRQWAFLLLFGPLTVAVSLAFTAYSGYSWAWPWVAALVPALLGGGLGLMSFASVTALVPGPDAHKRPDNPLDRADTTGQSNVLFWAALVLAVPAAAVVTLGTVLDSPILRWLGAPIGVATGVLLARWLGRVAADRLTAHGPELLFLMKTGRAGRPGTAAGVGARAKPELTKRQEWAAGLSWIFGSLALFPQGLVPLLFLIIGARVKSWFLALYLPHAWSWVTVAVMISTGTVLYTQAIRLSSGRTSRRTAPASPETGEAARAPNVADPKEIEPV